MTEPSPAPYGAQSPRTSAESGRAERFVRRRFCSRHLAPPECISLTPLSCGFGSDGDVPQAEQLMDGADRSQAESGTLIRFPGADPRLRLPTQVATTSTDGASRSRRSVVTSGTPRETASST